MRAGETSAPWLEVGHGALDKEVQSGRSRDETGASDGSSQALSDWTLLFAFAAMMIIPFVLVAWLMS